MVFISKLPRVSRPRCDVFTYLTSARRPFSEDRIIYYVDGTGEKLTYRDLIRKSRQLAHHLNQHCSVRIGDVVAICARDTVSCRPPFKGLIC